MHVSDGSGGPIFRDGIPAFSTTLKTHYRDDLQTKSFLGTRAGSGLGVFSQEVYSFVLLGARGQRGKV